jgi:hypothetical protein
MKNRLYFENVEMIEKNNSLYVENVGMPLNDVRRKAVNEFNELVCTGQIEVKKMSSVFVGLLILNC